MKEWLDVDRSAFLAELLRLDGQRQFANRMCICQESLPAEYRCTDCFSGRLVCQPCILKQHVGNPLHRVEVRFHS